MKKKLLVILLLLLISSLVYSKDDKATAPVENEPVSTPQEKPGIVAPNKQSPTRQEAVNLETAYKREFAFLEAQKRELAERLKNYQVTAKREEQALSSRLACLSAVLWNVQLRLISSLHN